MFAQLDVRTENEPVAVVIDVGISRGRIIVVGGAVAFILAIPAGLSPGSIQLGAHFQEHPGLKDGPALVLHAYAAFEGKGVGRVLVHVEGPGAVGELHTLLEGETEVVPRHLSGSSGDRSIR